MCLEWKYNGLELIVGDCYKSVGCYKVELYNIWFEEFVYGFFYYLVFDEVFW